MIRVVIADDEVKVCKLICGLIDWKTVDMEIVGVANNGIEALELIKTLQPDLMITDIRMPGCDGLELINRGKQIKKDIDFIIISGYNHFEYAQSAIKYGVSDYLLKPIKKNELLDTLNRIREKYRQRTEQLSNEEQMKIRMQNDSDKLRCGFFIEKLLYKGINAEEFEIEKCNKDYHFKFQPGYFQVFIVKLDCEYADLFESTIRILEDKIAQILRGFLKSECFDMEICFRGCRAYCVLNYSDNNKKNVRKQLKSGLDELIVQRSVFDKIEVTIGLGSAERDINQLKASLGAAESAIEQRLIEGTQKLIEDIPMQDSSLCSDGLLADLTRGMEIALEISDSNGVVAAIEQLRDKILNKSSASISIAGEEILRLVEEACSIYLTALRNCKFNIENAEQFYENFTLHADLCSSALQLFTYLSRVISESVYVVIEDRKQADIKPIRTAKQYIQQNYMNPISLKEVSAVVGFNDSYFSSLFKKESGQNFLEYLSEVRMNKAKELLKETDLSIAVICQKVGYIDLKHFTKCFKKYSGLKPNEFRKIYS